MNDILEQMTKNEIIAWIRSSAAYLFHPPKKSSLLFARWQTKTKLLQERDKAHCDELGEVDFSERDKYAREFNASEDTEEKLSLLNKIKPYDDMLSKNIAESQKIRKEYKKLDKLYDQIDIERKKETK